VRCPHPLSCALSLCHMANLYGLSFPAIVWGMTDVKLTIREVAADLPSAPRSPSNDV